MVVVIIVGILAAVAVPKMGATRKRAIAAEALAGCSAIKRHLDVLGVEGVVDSSLEGKIAVTLDNSAFSGDLAGTYFSVECYELTTVNDINDWLITVTGDDSTAGDAAKGIVVTLKADGTQSITFK